MATGASTHHMINKENATGIQTVVGQEEIMVRLADKDGQPCMWVGEDIAMSQGCVYSQVAHLGAIMAGG